MGPELQPAGPDGRVIARHYRTGGLLRLAWENHRLVEVATCEGAADLGLRVAPGLFDLQVNGYAGVDFQRDESISRDALLHAVRALRRDGCNRILLTLITDEWPRLLERLRRLRELVRSDAELDRAIPGWHIEGPFISDKPGYVGAHDPGRTLDPSPALVGELKAAAGEDPLLLTLAPERAGAVEAIRDAVRRGFVVSLGHSDATSPQLEAALRAGATLFTHLGNGCPQLLDRHDNILWRASELAGLRPGLIADGIHVSPPLFRILHRLHGAGRVWWTTDAMSAAGAPPGIHTLGASSFEVGGDGVVRHPLTGGFAGSSATPIDAVRRGSAMLGLPWQEGWDHLSTFPAEIMRLESDLRAGSAAGFQLLRDP